MIVYFIDCTIVNGDCLTQCEATNTVATPGCSCLKGYKEVEGVSCEGNLLSFDFLQL